MKEKKRYKSLSGFQKTVVDSLKSELDFEYKHCSVWRSKTSNWEIDLNQMHSLGDLIKNAFENGRAQR